MQTMIRLLRHRTPVAWYRAWLPGFVLFALFASVAPSAAQQQLRLSLTMSPRPSPYLSEWASRREMVVLTVTNIGGAPVEAKISARVSLDDNTKAETKPESMPQMTIPPGVSTYYADQVLPYDAVRFFGDVERTAVRTGMLPAGVYQLCVELVDPQTGRPVSQPACRQFSITSYQLPDLQAPENGKTLSVTERPTFRWSPVIPAPTGGARYRLRVVELLQGQAASSAIREGLPLLERDITAQTQLLWPPDFILPDAAKRFAWSVQTVDEQGNPVGDREGWSEPFTFSVSTGAGPGGGGVKPADSTAAVLAGVVRDVSTNAPIAGARVVYRPVVRTVIGLGRSQKLVYTTQKDSIVAVTGPDGRFSLSGVRIPSYYELNGRASGYIPKTERGPAQHQTQSITDFTLLLRADLCVISGRVIDSLAKTGLPNITVELWQKRPQPAVRSGASKQGLQFALLNALISSARTDGAGGTPTTRYTPGSGFNGTLITAISTVGNFSFDSIPGGSGYFLVINDGSYRKYTSVPFSVSGAESKSLGTIRLQPYVGRIEGIVRDKKTNLPLAGAKVYLYPDVGPSLVGGAKAFPGGVEAGELTRLGNSGWSPSVGNTPQLKEAAGYNDARKNNGAFIPAGGAGAGGGTSGGGGGSGAQVERFEWGSTAAWSPKFTGGGGPPPSKPEADALRGPVQTDVDGRFVFENVPINDPKQSSDRYAVWAVTIGYDDAWKGVRISQQGQTKQITLFAQEARGIIHGTVVAANGGGALGNVKVELKQTVMGKSSIVATAYTNPDGTYTLYGLAPGSYAGVQFTKTGVKTYEAPGPISISAGTVMQIDASLTMLLGTVRGTVTVNNAPAPGVLIHSELYPHLSATTYTDGTFIIPNVPIGETPFSFSQPGCVDATVTAKLQKQGDTAKLKVALQLVTGSITVMVQDSATKAPIANARVSITGGGTKTTNLAGQAVFPSVGIGPKSVSVLPDTSESAPDYKPFSTSVLIGQGLNEAVIVNMLKGARVSGRVESLASLQGLDSVEVSAAGVPAAKVLTKPDGSFTIRNLPAGVEIKLSASRPGWKSGKAPPFTLTPGEQKENVLISLDQAPLATMFGFPVEIDTLYEMGGRRYIQGKLVSVPGNEVMALQEAGFKFHFGETEIDTDNKPVAKSVLLEHDEVRVTVFGMKAKMIDSVAFLRVTWVDSLGVGMIYGNKIVVDKLIPTWIPGAKWAEEKITWAANQLPVSLFSDGVFHGGKGPLGVGVSKTEVGVELFGFRVAVDYAKTKLDDKGFHYAGSIKIPGISNTIIIEDLFFSVKDKNTGELEFNSVKVKTSPPLTINLGVFKIIDSTATWDQTGFKATGAIILTPLNNKKFGFRDLWISKDGDFLGVTIDLDPAAGTISVGGASFQIASIGLGTDIAGEVKTRYVFFNGKLTIPQLSSKIEFQNLKYTEKGDFTGTIMFNQSVTFMSVVTLQLQAVEFGKETKNNVERKYVFLKGGIAFNIPMLSVQVGNFRFYEGGDVNVEQIGIGFTAGPVKVAVSLSWTNNVFEGSGTLIIQPVFSVTGQFRYGGANDWWIKIKAGLPPIPIGPFTIVGIAGELGRQGSSWTFGFGGSVTVGNAKEAIKLDLYVKVTTSPQGPVIQGTADVIVMSGTTIGHAEILIDTPNKLFAGSIDFGWKKTGLTLNAWIDIEVKANQYWFVGAGVKVNLLDAWKIDASLYIGKNYTGWMHTLPVKYHPDNEPLNGFHLDATTGWGKDGDSWGLRLDWWVYFAIDWNVNLSGGIRFKGTGSFDLWIIGGSGLVDLEAALQYSSNRFKFYGSVVVDLKLWLAPCSKQDECWTYCFPTGGTACFAVDVKINYDSVSGWDVAVKW